MEGLLAALIVALAGLAGNAWIAGRGLSHQARMAKEAQKETRRTKRQEYLAQLMERLLKSYEDFQAFLGKPPDYQGSKYGDHEHSEIVGRATAACLATADEELQAIASGKDGVGLTPYRLLEGENGSKEDYKDRNRAALLRAIKRLAVLMVQVE